MESFQKILFISIIALLFLFLLTGFKSAREDTTLISWYGKTHQGKKTASGEIFDMNKWTAAHKTLKFGTKVKFINLKNNRWVIVTINDRGPYIKNRDFDLSKSAFEELASTKEGIIRVKYEILK